LRLQRKHNIVCPNCTLSLVKKAPRNIPESSGLSTGQEPVELVMRSHAVILATALVWLIGLQSAEAKLDILVDKATQRMLVIQDGYIRYMWPVSTGRDNMATPNGVYAPQRLERNWFSREYYDSPMPFSIFFHGGYAIHGSYAIDRLGGPASHGCVRLHPHHAAILFDLVQQEGPSSTSIEITDQGRPPEGPPVPGRDSASLQGAYPPALPSRDTVGMGPGANPPVPPREIAGAGPGAYPPMGSRDVAGGGPGAYPPVPPRDIAGAGPGAYPPASPRDISGVGPGMYPPVPRRLRLREDAPDLPPALRGNQPMPSRASLPPQPPTQPAPPRRMMANIKPAEGLESVPASGPPRMPSQASEPRSKPKLMEVPKIIMGPRVAEGSSPPPAQPGSSASFKLLPASCWSGGASRWQWWASRQENQCKQ
jgi:L,D-transpeptidase catalytic domain